MSLSFHFVYVVVLLKPCRFYTNKDSLWHATELMPLAIAFSQWRLFVLTLMIKLKFIRKLMQVFSVWPQFGMI